MMVKVLFVCHGNICRSPMAEFVFKEMIQQERTGYAVASAATSTEEIGNPVYPPVRRLLLQKGIDPEGKTARQITARDYADYDLIVGMDNANLRNLRRMFSGDPEGKCCRLLDFTEHPGEVADPWYTRDFDKAYCQIHEGCAALLARLQQAGLEGVRGSL